MEIVNEKPVSIYEVKEEVTGMKKRDKELNFRAKKVEEYLGGVAKLKKAPIDFRKELEALEITRLRAKSIAHLMNVCPLDLDSLRAILSTENLTLKEEDLNKILNVVKKYA
jgi:DNA-directed RNA polymerase subunit F